MRSSFSYNVLVQGLKPWMRNDGYSFFRKTRVCGMKKSAKRDLWLFVVGVIMLAVGLFIFSQRVDVSSSILGGWSVGSFHISSGMVMIPFIAGIIWMFASDGHIASKIFTALSALLIIVSIIISTGLHLETMRLFDWIIILVLIFGGLALVLRTLLGGKAPSKDEVKEEKIQDAKDARIEALERELEEIKKKQQ